MVGGLARYLTEMLEMCGALGYPKRQVQKLVDVILATHGFAKLRGEASEQLPKYRDASVQFGDPTFVLLKTFLFLMP